MARDVIFDLRKGGGSNLEILYGEVLLSPTNLHTLTSTAVLPTPTKVDLIAGQATFSQVVPTPAPVNGEIAWAYKVLIRDRHGNSWEYLVGVPDAVPAINFNVLPRYFETKPPAFGVGPAGPAGTAATIAVGTTTSGATPNVVNRGTSTAAILDFTLQKGDKGDTGAAGSGVNYNSNATFAAPPSSYSLGVTYTNGQTANGWPLNFLLVATEKLVTGRAKQTITNILNNTHQLRTEINGDLWGPFREIAYADLATPLLNGIMPATDKAKLDNFTLATNSKTSTALASTYPTGFSTVQVQASDGWPVTTTGNVVTVKTTAGNGGAAQWVYPIGGDPRYRIADASGAWGTFTTLLTPSYVTGRSYLNVRDFGAVGDGVADDTSAITSALAAALAANVALMWPAGSYLATTNLANLHLVNNLGDGKVLSNSQTFHVAPIHADANTIYVTPTGVDTNDGLSTGRSLRTLKKAMEVLANYAAPVLGGFWTVSLAAGSYSERAILAPGLISENRIVITGPVVAHPAVPTAIITQGYNNSAAAFIFRRGNAELEFNSLLFEGYNGTTSSAALNISGNSQETFLVNVHTTDCYWGGSFQTSAYDVKGGIHTRPGYLGDTAPGAGSRNGNGAAFRSLMLTRHSIGLQNAGTNANGPFIRGGVNGVFAQESCTGHVDWATIEDCQSGVNINVNSRANVDGTLFKRNAKDIMASGNSHVYVSNNTGFPSGADESGSKIVLVTGAQIVTDRMFTNKSVSYATEERIIVQNATQQTVTTTTNTILQQLTLTAGMWRDAPNSTVPKKKLMVKMYGSMAGTSGFKRLQIRLGSTNVSNTFTATEEGAFVFSGEVVFADLGRQFITAESKRHLGTSIRIAHGAPAEALTANTNFNVEALVEFNTSSIVIDYLEIAWV